MVLIGSTSLVNFGCTSEEDKSVELENSNIEKTTALPEIDFSQVFEKRIEGSTQEAISLLRGLNEKHPASVEVMIQLGRSLIDAKQFSLAAFRFEQALALDPSNALAKEAAEAHYLAGDFDSSIERYRQFFSASTVDSSSQLIFARMLADKGLATESLNAFSQASNHANANDCLIMANLFLQKKLLSQAKHWYSESANRSEDLPTQSLIGLLRVAKEEKKEEEAESFILALEKLAPGILESTDLAEFSANLLRRRKLANFIARGIDARGKSISELASGLLAGESSDFRIKSSVTGRSKLSTSAEGLPSDNFRERESIQEETTERGPEVALEPETASRISLADAFAAPIGQVKNAFGAVESSIDLGQKAYLERNYTSALLHARDALKKNSKDASAWRLCSQAHFQLGETNEAEMTILEAIRHQPSDLEMRMDYLRIARETLPSKRYLQELEKVREIFPDSTEILWELARRYHIVENMPVTAAVLYRKIVQIAVPKSAIAEQAEMELIKLGNL